MGVVNWQHSLGVSVVELGDASDSGVSQESQEEHGVPDTSPYLLVTRPALPLSRQLYNLGGEAG